MHVCVCVWHMCLQGMGLPRDMYHVSRLCKTIENYVFLMINQLPLSVFVSWRKKHTRTRHLHSSSSMHLSMFRCSINHWFQFMYSMKITLQTLFEIGKQHIIYPIKYLFLSKLRFCVMIRTEIILLICSGKTLASSNSELAENFFFVYD